MTRFTVDVGTARPDRCTIPTLCVRRRLERAPLDDGARRRRTRGVSGSMLGGAGRGWEGAVEG